MKITVVIAVLNSAKGLEETLGSVLANTGSALDCIVIDGGSTDGSVEMLRKHDGRLKYWVSEPDRGVYDAMNKGWVQAALDSWVIFLGAGDRLLSLPEKSFCGGTSPEVWYGDVCLDQGRVFHARAGYRLKLYNSLHHQALLVPRQLHPAPPFNLDFPLYADFDFNQRLYREGVGFRYVPGLRAYAAPGGLTADLKLEELTRIVRLNFGLFWSGLSRGGFLLARTLPFLRNLRPIH